MTHVLRENCKCRMKCFEVVPDDAKKSILKNFNLMTSSNDQVSYFVGLHLFFLWFGFLIEYHRMKKELMRLQLNTGSKIS